LVAAILRARQCQNGKASGVGASRLNIFPTLSFSSNEKGAKRLGQRERVGSPEFMTLAAGFGDGRRVPNNLNRLDHSGSSRRSGEAAQKRNGQNQMESCTWD
jgi:hypothetical protein